MKKQDKRWSVAEENSGNKTNLSFARARKREAFNSLMRSVWRSKAVKNDLNSVTARMRTEIDLNCECEHFLETNWYRFEIDLSWMRCYSGNDL